MESELFKEQQLWSLNGSFEALHKMMEAISTGKITDLLEMKDYILLNMKVVNEQIIDTEDALKV